MPSSRLSLKLQIWFRANKLIFWRRRWKELSLLDPKHFFYISPYRTHHVWNIIFWYCWFRSPVPSNLRSGLLLCGCAALACAACGYHCAGLPCDSFSKAKNKNGCTVHDVVAWCEIFVPTLNTLSHATTTSIFGIGPLKRLQRLLFFLRTLRSCFAPRLIAVRFTPVRLPL